MPFAAPTRCSWPACRHLAVARGRCDQHQPQPWTRPSQHTKLIDKTLWAKVRVQILARDHGKCVLCGAPAVDVDHIRPVADGGALYDDANLRSLCRPCHRIVTLEQRRQRSRRRLG